MPLKKNAQAFELTPSQSRILAAQDFEHQAPGTILADFDTLLRLIGEEGMPVTPAYLLAMNSLETINRDLTHPLVLGLKRPVQKSYPHINGLYLLVRATGLSVIDTRFKKPLLKLDPSVLGSWRSLNAAERYFALLKAWWGRANEEIIGERQGMYSSVLKKLLDFMQRFQKTKVLMIKEPQEADMLRYYPGLYNLALMELFGLLEIRTLSSEQGKGWFPGRMQMTDWGNVILGGYAACINRSLSIDASSAAPMFDFFEALLNPLEGFERWSQLIRPSIKAWRKDLEIPTPSFQPGTHVFKVSLGTDCWRRIAIRGDDYFDDLAAAILDAFNFDSDHLYCFSYKDRFGCTVTIDHPYLEGDTDNALSNDVKIGDIPISEGMRIRFLFDFGDNWEFEIQTEGVNTGTAIKATRVLEKHGKAPKQYGGY